MIIIKSQDGRSIINCNDVRQNEGDKTEIISNVKCVHYDTENYEFIHDYNLLGTYDSEERAKEVMNMIYTHIHMTHAGIFTMPKE